ncbi:MAG TPA: hypothetical protein VLN74_11085 [Ilumatobacteraceae bacterium]|nr:hypothetical protein [Ilumatobacteraceae bacterium]
MTSSFAPPTGAPVTGSPAATLPQIEPAPVSTPPGGRRRPFALAAAVVAVLALGVAAVALATGRSGDGVDVTEPYSLTAAAQSAITARTVEFDLTVSASDLADVTVTGAVDNESQLMSVTTDLSSLLALGDMPLPFDGGDITVLVDGSTDVVYLDAAALGGLLGAEAAWVSIDLGVLAEQSGQSLPGGVPGGLALDPTDIARSLLDTDSATEIGVETIDGVEVKHYEVTVDVAAALESAPQAGIDPALADIELPDTVVYDVFVTADNQLRRVAFDTVIAGQSIAMQLDMITSNDPLGVELPAESDVFDLTGLLGF